MYQVISKLREIENQTRLVVMSIWSEQMTSVAAWPKKFVSVTEKGQGRSKTIMGCLAVTVTVLRRRRRRSSKEEEIEKEKEEDDEEKRKETKKKKKKKRSVRNVEKQG